jgi:hypothetical protein
MFLITLKLYTATKPTRNVAIVGIEARNALDVEHKTYTTYPRTVYKLMSRNVRLGRRKQARSRFRISNTRRSLRTLIKRLIVARHTSL